jgi:predicted nucleotidyltransferase component of viral defense system
MIPNTDIRAWGNKVPWKLDQQIEQDLVICRSLIEIFKDPYLSEHLAFRGGTALHKLYITSHARYSEDIDLVQKDSGPIKGVIDGLRSAFLFLGDPKVRQKANNNTLIFRFDSESDPPIPMRLKIEINCREHFSVLGYKQREISVDSRWFKGSALVHTYALEEILGTKLRALYQRKKGRDLYDLYKAITVLDTDQEKILSCYKSYMKFGSFKIPTRKQYINNLTEKISDLEFINDTKALLQAGESYDPKVAFELITKELLSKL